jgi:exodeoxyribonuclease VII small subunit
MIKKDTKNQSFEMQLALLEKIVRELERGDLPLEKSLELFEQGVKLSRACQERLKEAERRIEILLRGADGEPRIAALDELPRIVEESEDDEENVF